VAAVGAPSVNSSNTTAVINVVPTTSPQDAATTQLANNLRDSVLPTVPAKTYVVGTTAAYIDFTAKIGNPACVLAAEDPNVQVRARGGRRHDCRWTMRSS
jgi:hypothetical protein